MDFLRAVRSLYPAAQPGDFSVQKNGDDFVLARWNIPIAAPTIESLKASAESFGLGAARSCASARIDHAAEAARLKYITGGAGQAATYLTKAAQARAYQAAGFTGTVPGYVQAEASARDVTAQVAALTIIGEEEAWHDLGAAIELVRRTGKVAVAVGDEAEVAAAMATALSALEAI